MIIILCIFTIGLKFILWKFSLQLRPNEKMDDLYGKIMNKHIASENSIVGSQAWNALQIYYRYTDCTIYHVLQKVLEEN